MQAVVSFRRPVIAVLVAAGAVVGCSSSTPSPDNANGLVQLTANQPIAARGPLPR